VTLETTLFILRLLSGIVLLGVVLVLFRMVWREYEASARQADQVRRVYGQLVALASIDNQLIPTGANYPLLPITSIGRSPTNTVVIDNAFASSEHAVIALRHGQWWLEDRNSRNGTQLNNEPVTLSTIVTGGDIVGIGTHYFQIVLE